MRYSYLSVMWLTESASPVAIRSSTSLCCKIPKIESIIISISFWTNLPNLKLFFIFMDFKSIRTSRSGRLPWKSKSSSNNEFPCVYTFCNELYLAWFEHRYSVVTWRFGWTGIQGSTDYTGREPEKKYGRPTRIPRTADMAVDSCGDREKLNILPLTKAWLIIFLRASVVLATSSGINWTAEAMARERADPFFEAFTETISSRWTSWKIWLKNYGFYVIMITLFTWRHLEILKEIKRPSIWICHFEIRPERF